LDEDVSRCCWTALRTSHDQLPPGFNWQTLDDVLQHRCPLHLAMLATPSAGWLAGWLAARRYRVARSLQVPEVLYDSGVSRPQFSMTDVSSWRYLRTVRWVRHVSWDLGNAHAVAGYDSIAPVIASSNLYIVSSAHWLLPCPE
jgi:hypothetical protein